MKKMFLGVLIFSFLLVLGFGFLQSEAFAQTQKSLPKLMKWSTYDIGGIAYVTAAILADTISQKTGIKIRAIPCETDIARLTPLRSGDVVLAATGAGAYFSREGLAEFSHISWGPQPWQVLWQTQHPGATVYVRRDSGIKTAADLRGKRITSIPGFPAVNFQMEGHLAFAGITWKDVKIVECTSYADSCKAVIEGRADAAAIGTTSSYAYELEGTTHGIHYIPLPASDKEGWARIKKTLFSYAVPVTVTVGAGLSKDKPLETATYGYPILAVRPDLDEEIAYLLTQNIHGNYPIYSKKQKEMELYWTLDVNMYLSKVSYFPVHKGAIRYLKEIKAWTPEHEKWNEKMLERTKTLKELWENTVAEAGEKKIKAKEFPAFWLEKRAKMIE